MIRLIILFLLMLSLDGCRSDQVRPGEVEGILKGYVDDTYNPCAGWIFSVGSNEYPAREVPQDFKNRKEIKIWLKYEPDTTASKVYACNFIKVLSIRKRR